MPERSDLSLRRLAVGAAIVLGGIAATLVAAGLLTVPIESTEVQPAPQQDLASFLREKRQRLESGGPIEGDASHVRIPIEQAMRLLVERSRR